MIKKLLLIILISVTFSQDTNIEYEDLNFRGGLYYKKNSQKGFTGGTTMIKSYGDGNVYHYFDIVNGRVINETVYRLISDEKALMFTRQYHPNSKLKKYVHYDFYNLGQIKRKWNFDEEGLLHGDYITYYGSNGQIKEQGIYKNGIKNGPFKNYELNGKFLGTTIYSNGDIVNIVDGPKWKNIENWKKLKQGMSMIQVSQILGTPYGQGKESRRGFSIMRDWYYDEKNLRHSSVIFSKTDDKSFLENYPERGEYRLDKWTEISYQKLNEMNNEQSDFEKKSETIINNLDQLK